jgi:hypothetical protein
MAMLMQNLSEKQAEVKEAVVITAACTQAQVNEYEGLVSDALHPGLQQQIVEAMKLEKELLE